jgi:hypothetical protein
MPTGVGSFYHVTALVCDRVSLGHTGGRHAKLQSQEGRPWRSLHTCLSPPNGVSLTRGDRKNTSDQPICASRLYGKVGQGERVRMVNTLDRMWRSYESIVQGIFQLLYDQHLVHNVRVRRNVTLQGKSGPHQIDVYWKFEIGGVPHEVIVQAKHWSKAVDKGELLKFKAVIDDFPGSTGVFVTKKGYQRGAREYASKNGITLFQLDESRPHNVDISRLGWAQGWITVVPLHGSQKNEGVAAQKDLAIGTTYTVFTPRFSDLRFQHDDAWFKQNPLMSSIAISAIKLPPTQFRDIILYDESQAVVSNLELILRQVIEVMKEEKSDKKHFVHTFDCPTFLGPPVTATSYIKVNSVSANINIESSVLPLRFGNSKFVAFVLHHISSSKTQWFFRPKE